MSTLMILLASVAVVYGGYTVDSAPVLWGGVAVSSVLTTALALDVWAAAGVLDAIGERAHRLAHQHSVPRWLTSLGVRFDERSMALRYRQERLDWELHTATRDIVRAPVIPQLLPSTDGGPLRPIEVTIRECLARLDDDFRHAAAVVTDGEDLWVSSGRIGGHLKAMFSREIELARACRSQPFEGSALEVLGFRPMLFEWLTIAEKRCVCWLGYMAERPPTDIERARFPVLVREFQSLLEIESQQRRSVERVVAAESRSERHTKLIAEVSHDIRSPLSNIKAILNLFRVEGFGSDARSLVDIAIGNCEAMDETVSALIDLSRVQSGTLHVRRERAELGPLIRSVVESFMVSAKLKGLAILVEVSPDVPPIEVDRGQCRRTLANLVSNAVKYTERGSIIVRAQRGHRHAAVIEVADSGCGLSDHQQAQLFQPFQRFHVDMAEGVGLGLVLTRSLVELNGGTLSVQSRLGVGSTFRIEFPGAGAEEARGGATVTLRDQSVQETRVPRVLLVDDDRDCVDTLARVMLGRGFRVQKAYGVEEALRWMQSGDIDVIVSDSRMPGGGVERLIADAGARRPCLPVIVLTGSDSDAERFAQRGASRVLTKPAELDELCSAIHKAMVSDSRHSAAA